jgi:hypothetical protein
VVDSISEDELAAAAEMAASPTTPLSQMRSKVFMKFCDQNQLKAILHFAAFQ